MERKIADVALFGAFEKTKPTLEGITLQEGGGGCNEVGPQRAFSNNYSSRVITNRNAAWSRRNEDVKTKRHALAEKVRAAFLATDKRVPFDRLEN